MRITPTETAHIAGPCQQLNEKQRCQESWTSAEWNTTTEQGPRNEQGTEVLKINALDTEDKFLKSLPVKREHDVRTQL